MYTLEAIKYKHILDIDHLEIPAQTITCIVGESGSGKTTILKLLNKLISPDAGKILFHGEDTATMDSIQLRRKVVMLPQTPAIFPGNIRENLLIGLMFAQMAMVEDQTLEEILAAVNLHKALDEDADKLSGGEKQRLALCRILLMDPEVFLLDEPSSALDDETEHAIIHHLVEFSKQTQKTLIMVTHSKQIAKDFGEKVIEIKAGKVHKNGKAQNG